jgi:hypothetical protein
MTSGDVPVAPIFLASGQCCLIENLSLSDSGFCFPFGIVLAIFCEMTLLTPFTVTGEVTSSEENQK